MNPIEVSVDLNHHGRRVQRAKMRRMLKNAKKWGSVSGPPPPKIYKRKPSR